MGRKSREILKPDIQLLYVKSSGGQADQFLTIMNPEMTVVLKTLLIPTESDIPCSRGRKLQATVR